MPLARLLSGVLCSMLLATPVAAASLESLAADIARHDAALSQLWPGYWPPGQPFVLYRGTRCVMRSATPPQGFTAIDGHEDLWLGRCDEPRFRGPMLLREEIGGIAAPAVEIDSHRDTLERAATYLLHEAFHGYQADAFDDVDRIATDYAFPLDDELVRMKLREASFLLSAADTDDTARAVTLVRAAIATREARLARMPAEARTLEDRYLAHEGTAEYVDIRAGTLVQGRESPLDYVRTALRRRSDGLGRTWEYLLRWQSYSTGAAAGLLLDRWKVDWQPHVEAGRPLYEILALASGYEAAQQAALLDAAANADSGGTHARAKQLIATDRAAGKALAQFEAKADFVLEVTDDVEDATASFTTRELHTVPGGTLVMSPQPYASESRAAELEVRGRPLRIHERDDDDPDSRGFIEITLPKAPEIDGCDAAADRCSAGSTVRGRGVTMQLKRDHHVERTPTRWRLRPVED